jgi:hypothetical protein
LRQSFNELRGHAWDGAAFDDALERLEAAYVSLPAPPTRALQPSSLTIGATPLLELRLRGTRARRGGPASCTCQTLIAHLARYSLAPNKCILQSPNTRLARLGRASRRRASPRVVQTRHAHSGRFAATSFGACGALASAALIGHELSARLTICLASTPALLVGQARSPTCLYFTILLQPALAARIWRRHRLGVRSRRRHAISTGSNR